MMWLINLIAAAFWTVTGHLPTLEIKKIEADDSLFQISCNTSESFLAFGKSAQNILVEFYKSGNVCKFAIDDPKKTPSYFQCECLHESVVACNISVEHNCERIACGVLIDGTLEYGEFVNICKTGTNIENNDDTYANCSKTHSNHEFPDWVINDAPINTSDGHALKINRYDRNNVSELLNLFVREDDSSIVICKLAENQKGDKWHIHVLLPPRISNMLNYGNPNVTLVKSKRGNAPPNCTIQSTTRRPETLIPLCDAVNDAKTGANQFVQNLRGKFQLDKLFPAFVRNFYIDGFENQQNLTLTKKATMQFLCNGTGNPPPNTTLMLDQAIVTSTNHSSFQHELHLNDTRYTGLYTCVSSNALGIANKSLFVQIQILPSNQEETPSLVAIPVCTGSICVLAILIAVIVKARKQHKYLNCFLWLCSSGLTNNDNELHTTDTNRHEERNHSNGFDGANTDHETTADEDCLPPLAHATIAFSFENETYAGCIDTPRLHEDKSQIKHSSRDGQQNTPSSLELDSMEDDPLYSAVARPGPSFAATTVPHQKMKQLHEGHLRLADSTYSVVNKNTRLKHTPYSVANTPNKPDDMIYSVAKQIKRLEDYTYSVVNKPKRKEKRKNEEASGKSPNLDDPHRESSKRSLYSVVNKHADEESIEEAVDERRLCAE